LGKGLIEKIGEPKSSVSDHSQGIKKIISDILDSKVIQDLKDIAAVGHRVVHGGETFTKPHVIDSSVLKKIKECAPLAPLHNPANLSGIIGCQKFMPKTMQVAVFDTAFHQTMPAHAFIYSLPRKYYLKYKVRKYGFHGTSHQFVSQQAAQILNKPLSKTSLITCHLGNGCSITAVKGGKSIDTSMGFTPLEGLMMGTRSGDVDPAAVFFIMKHEGLSIEQMDDILNKKSGLLGVSGLSNDMRTVKKAKARGDSLAKLAYGMFIYRIIKYIGAYALVLGSVDAICFTGGIGEHEKGVVNKVRSSINALFDSKIKILIIPTDEELMIAKLTKRVVSAEVTKKRGIQ
ncbi:MAG: acetate kinase, partial [Candidatus Omnitrophica bacterium]|nr:acetate kinase [Candidatus Omnitrophota bacterium]